MDTSGKGSGVYSNPTANHPIPSPQQHSQTPQAFPFQSPMDFGRTANTPGSARGDTGMFSDGGLCFTGGSGDDQRDDVDSVANGRRVSYQPTEVYGSSSYRNYRSNVPDGSEAAGSSLTPTSKINGSGAGGGGDEREDPEAQTMIGGNMTFQDLASMDFAMGESGSQKLLQDGRQVCRKRKSMASKSNTFSTAYFTNEPTASTSAAGNADMLEAEPSSSDYCFPSSTSATTTMMSHHDPRASTSSVISKAEPGASGKHFQMETPAMMRRSVRINQMQQQQQQQQQQQPTYLAPQRVVEAPQLATPLPPIQSLGYSTPMVGTEMPMHYPEHPLDSGQVISQEPMPPDPNSHYIAYRRAHLADCPFCPSMRQGYQYITLDPPGYYYETAASAAAAAAAVAAMNRDHTAAWGHMTKQQQLAIVNNPRWRLAQNIPLQSSLMKQSQQPQQQQQQQQQSVANRVQPATTDLPMESTEPKMVNGYQQNMMVSSNGAPGFDFNFDGGFRSSVPYEMKRKSSDGTGQSTEEEVVDGRTNERLFSILTSRKYTPEEFNFFDEPFGARWGSVKLTLVQQPEHQHRARYLTEGSRGPIKNRNYDGFPTIQLSGWTGQAVVHVFVASEVEDPHLHLFYQVCLVSTKSNRGCREINCGCTTVVQVPFNVTGEERMLSVDSVGLVKLRNSDVERRMSTLDDKEKSRYMRGRRMTGSNMQSTSSAQMGGQSTSGMSDEISRRSMKPKSSCARLVYRVFLLDQEGFVAGVVQVISDPIRCTQIVGGPEICRMSLRQADSQSQPELFIIGKNFVRGSRVIFRQVAELSAPISGTPRINPPNAVTNTVSTSAGNTNRSEGQASEDGREVLWEKDAEIDSSYFYQTHLICKVPEYQGPQAPLTAPLQVEVLVQTPSKIGRPEKFTYLPPKARGGAPVIKRLSVRESPVSGMVEMIILGSNFSRHSRVFFRQFAIDRSNTGNNDSEAAFSSFNEILNDPSKIVWQREAQISNEVTESHIVCCVPPYDGCSTNPVRVEVQVEDSAGIRSRPEHFFYV